MTTVKHIRVLLTAGMVAGVVLVSGKKSLAQTERKDSAAKLEMGKSVELPPLDADAYWAWAKKKDTAQAYRCFVYHYPDDPRTAQARRQREELDFDEVLTVNTASAYRRFLRHYPDGRFGKAASKEVQERLRKGDSATTTSLPDTPLVGRALDALVLAVRDPDQQVQAYAVDTLSEIPRFRATKLLIPELDNPDWYYVRSSAAEALGRIGGSWATDALVAALQDDSPYVRGCSAEALGGIGDNRAVKALISSLSDSSAYVRECSAVALGRIGDGLAIDALIRLREDPMPAVQVAAIMALGRIGDTRAMGSLIETLHGGDWYYTRSSAAKALGELGDAGACDALVTSLTDTNPHVRKCSAWALGQINDDTVVDVVLRRLENAESLSRSIAARALGTIGDPRACSALVARLNDSDTDVRVYATEALGKIGDLHVVPAISSALQQQDIALQRKAAEALGRIGCPASVRVLIDGLKKADPSVRTKAADALGEIGDISAIEPLVLLLDDTDAGVRSAAVRTLGRIGDSRAGNAIIAAVEDSDMNVQAGAIEALGAIEGSKAEQVLIAKLAKSEAWYLRRLAMQALGSIGGPQARDALIELLEDRAGAVRDVAAQALAQIALRYSVAPLQSYANNPDEKIREGVMKALAIVSSKKCDLLFSSTRNRRQEDNPRDSRIYPTRKNGNVLAQIKDSGSRVTADKTRDLADMLKQLDRSSIDDQMRLIDELSDSSVRQPQQAKEILRRIRVQTKSEIVGLKALGGLVSLEDRHAIKEIEPYVKSKDPIERIYAAELLGEGGRWNVAKELVTALGDSSPLVRVHAATAILRTVQHRAANGKRL